MRFSPKSTCIKGLHGTKRHSAHGGPPLYMLILYSFIRYRDPSNRALKFFLHLQGGIVSPQIEGRYASTNHNLEE